MTEKISSGIFIFEDPEDFLKMMDELQRQYNSRVDEDGVE